MAKVKGEGATRSGYVPKKADVILRTEQEISYKQEEVMNQAKLTNTRLDAALEMFAKSLKGSALISKQISEVFNKLTEENKALKQELLYLAKQNENIYTGLTSRIDKLENESMGPAAPASVRAELDYDLLAEKVADILSTRERIDPDYIASKVAEQIVVPEVSAPAPQVIQTAGVPVVATANVDEDELADKISARVGSIKAEDYEILVDDEGCASISKEIVERLDYDVISAAVAEKLRGALDLASVYEPDYDEMAARLSEKITVGGVNEDAIAEKTAQAVTNVLPDTDDIADKVTASVMEALPSQQLLDSDAICAAVSEKIIESQNERDYDIVIDEEGIEKITEEVRGATDERFNKVDREIDEIKAMLAAGAVTVVSNETAASEAAYDESELVTVSDLVTDEIYTEENSELDEIVEDLDEQLAEGEMLDDGAPDGVDFAHMMKYNRSFIARIIQGSDEQKEYYGQVKTALLSYRKVNSSIAWGAERFNKGRETIAKFKIRGKTLCLYLALDPNEYKTSVYHHVDVSDNKSMHGTPMMVKIKSPLGARKAIRLIDEMLEKRGGVKHKIQERDYAAMYPYESMDQLIEDGLVKDVRKS